jgi:predicted DNA-binding transcriptional regulator AlpA
MMLDAIKDDDEVIERPRAAARAMGFSLATFWRRAKDDPEFPPLYRLSRRIVGIKRGDRRRYVDAGRQEPVAE